MAGARCGYACTGYGVVLSSLVSGVLIGWQLHVANSADRSTIRSECQCTCNVARNNQCAHHVPKSPVSVARMDRPVLVQVEAQNQAGAIRLPPGTGETHVLLLGTLQPSSLRIPERRARDNVEPTSPVQGQCGSDDLIRDMALYCSRVLKTSHYLPDRRHSASRL